MSDMIQDLSKIQIPRNEKAPSNTSQNGKEKKTPSQFWLNVGIMRGEGEQRKLVALPQGIALDGLEARKIPGVTTKNPEFRALRIAEAQLWQLFQAKMATLKPGEEIEVPLVCRLRRIDEKENVEDIDTSENPFSLAGFAL